MGKSSLTTVPEKWLGEGRKEKGGVVSAEA